MTSQKPYLIRAIYEWCNDNNFTPYLATVVNKHTLVPKEYVRDGQIVLNIAFSATKNLLIDNVAVTFQATFGGTIQNIEVPVDNIIAIFAKENGQGMQFEANLEKNINSLDNSPQKSGGLKLVK